MSWLYDFFLALFRAFWQAYVEVMLARKQAIKEVPDEEAEVVLSKFRAAVERMRSEQGSPPKSAVPASGSKAGEG